MNVWGTVTWDIARAGGFAAYILLTLSVAIGLALTLHWQSARWPRLINSEMHNFVTLLSLIFTGVHVLAVWIDPFTRFGWNEVLIPFASHYRPTWMALGIVSLYMGLAIALSTWLRPYIGYAWWRRLHVFTLVIFGLVLVHGIATGSDTSTWWGVIIYGGSVLLVGTLLWQRLYWPANAQSNAHPVIAMLVLVITLVGTVWTVLGPLQPGWNVIANNGNGSGAAIGVPVTNNSAAKSSGSSNNSFLPSFTGQLQGQMTQSGPDSNGLTTLQLHMTILNGPQGTVQVTLQGQGQGGDDGGLAVSSSLVTLGGSQSAVTYSGPLTQLNGDRLWHMTALLKGTGASSQQILVTMDIRVSRNSGQCSGTISGTGSTSASGSNI